MAKEEKILNNRKRFMKMYKKGQKHIDKNEKKEYLNRLSKPYTLNDKTTTFKAQFNHGQGNELKDKFFSVKSSSRYAFDLYSWLAESDNIIDICFEYALPGICGSPGHPNMDVFIKTFEDITFIESKFTEYSKIKLIHHNNSRTKSGFLAMAYYEELGVALNSTRTKKLRSTLNRRYYGHQEIAEQFKIFIKKIDDYIQKNKLNEKSDFFDAKQETCHLFGIVFYILKNSESIIKNHQKIRLWNVVFDFKEGVSDFADYYIEEGKKLVDDILKIEKIDQIEFEYSIIFSQDFLKTIPENVKGYATDKTMRELMSQYTFVDK